MPAFETPVDIANRACQHLGKPRVYTLFPIPDQSDAAQEIAACYHKVRAAELRRNLWAFATRYCALRALDTTSQLINFAAWSATYTYVDSSTGYPLGYVVKYDAGQGSQLYVSLANGNTATPGTPPTAGSSQLWEMYFGNLVCNAWNDTNENTTSTTTNLSYSMGELAYILLPSTGAESNAGNIYVSIANNNTNQPDVVDAWSSAIMYAVKAVVTYNGTNYQSKINQNFNIPPTGATESTAAWTSTVTQPLVSGSWIQLSSATFSPIPIVYPVGAGVAQDSYTRNAFRLPNGYLRRAIQRPKFGAVPYLGAHSGDMIDDWQFEDQYLTTNCYSFQINLRFIADITDPLDMDEMFCEGFAARIAKETAPTLNPERIKDALFAYTLAMSEARTVDAIEVGPVQQPEDSYISVRL